MAPADVAILAAVAEVERTHADHERALARLRTLVGSASQRHAEVLTLQQAAAIVGVHEDTMRDLAQRDGLGQKAGRWRCPRAEIDTYAASRRRA